MKTIIIINLYKCNANVTFTNILNLKSNIPIHMEAMDMLGDIISATREIFKDKPRHMRVYIVYIVYSLWIH